jgi:hypothetical protein
MVALDFVERLLLLIADTRSRYHRQRRRRRHSGQPKGWPLVYPASGEASEEPTARQLPLPDSQGRYEDADDSRWADAVRAFNEARRHAGALSRPRPQSSARKGA